MEKNNTYFDSLNLTECSGNGKPVIQPRCKAECECFGGWEGEYCERISANGGGDPHLETLDGKKQQFCLATNRSPFYTKDALSVWTNLGKHLQFVWLCDSSITTGTGRIIRLDELSFEIRLE